MGDLNTFINGLNDEGKKIKKELEKCKPFLIDLINRLDLRDTWPKHLRLHIGAFKKLK